MKMSTAALGRSCFVDRWAFRSCLGQNVSVQYHKRFVRYEEREDSVVAHFEDGTTVRIESIRMMLVIVSPPFLLTDFEQIKGRSRPSHRCWWSTIASEKAKVSQGDLQRRRNHFHRWHRTEEWLDDLQESSVVASSCFESLIGRRWTYSVAIRSKLTKLLYMVTMRALSPIMMTVGC